MVMPAQCGSLRTNTRQNRRCIGDSFLTSLNGDDSYSQRSRCHHMTRSPLASFHRRLQRVIRRCCLVYTSQITVCKPITIQALDFLRRLEQITQHHKPIIEYVHVQVCMSAMTSEHHVHKV